MLVLVRKRLKKQNLKLSGETKKILDKKLDQIEEELDNSLIDVDDEIKLDETSH